MVADNVLRLGAGELVHPERLELLPLALDRLTTDPRYRAAANAFAQRYAEWTSIRRLQHVIDTLTRLAEA